MKLLKRINLKKLIFYFKAESITMRRRLFFYIIITISVFLALILLLLNVFGIINPANTEIMRVLDSQLISCSDNIEHDYDEIATYAISFAEQLEDSIQDYLTENNLSFEQLENNAATITALQSKLYDTVYLNMQLAPSSGVFYILDTTVNSHSDTPLYNGIYLKYINLYSESTVNNEFSLYRGSFTTAKSNDITFHSGWQNEMETDFFEKCESIFTENTHYALSSTVEIPNTWENARYVYVPIHDLKGDIIGVCGFEINDLYFQLLHKTQDAELGTIVCALLDINNGEYSGQFSSNRYSITDDTKHTFKITEKNGMNIFDFGTDICIGKTKVIQLGNNSFTVGVLLTQEQYERQIQHGQMKAIAFFTIISIFAFVCCVFVSKKYVTPILKKIEHLKSNDTYGQQVNIQEIDDLFVFLEEKDIQYEEQLQSLEKARHDAEEETRRAKAAYEKAIKEYELAQSEIEQLSDERKNELVIEDYEYFISNLCRLTPSEQKIYELYLEGKTAKDIIKILDITENTLKYHNKNIYSKLGISSRKQLLRYATLKQHQDKKEQAGH